MQLEIGRTTDFKGVPYYIDRLNNLVRTFASAINFGTRLDGTRIPDVIGHVDGVDVNGNSGDPPTLFFTYTFVDEHGVTHHATFDDLDNYTGRVRNLSIFNIRADNFYVNPELLRNPLLMNASNPNIENPGDDEQPDHGVSNNLVLLSWLRVNQDNTVFAEGRLLDFIIGMTGELAIDIKQADSFSLNYNNITTHIDIQRMSISGVSINEEMANMIKFQQLFQASSRLINVIDQIYGTLVNNLGVT
jgi:flagellar hook-associated protein 1 FlgK